jgi:hypothetical protein
MKRPLSRFLHSLFSYGRESPLPHNTLSLKLTSYRYFRHYLNIKILWSVWNEFYLIPYVLSPAEQEV